MYNLKKNYFQVRNDKNKIMLELLCKLEEEQSLSKSEWIQLIDSCNPQTAEVLFKKARKQCEIYYNKKVFIRGLIEFTNFCKNNCYYCGIRRNNKNINRYRLTEDAIMSCCHTGYKLGFRTFVLQGGEDLFFTDDRMVSIIKSIKSEFCDCAVTLSIGERSTESYKRMYDAGADRFLLRHETFNKEHYESLHPQELSSENRQKCLYALKETGYQVGSGFMVGSPGQTTEHLAEDMIFLKQLNPHMVGIGPFIPHHDTPFKNEKSGTIDKTLYMIGLLRLMLPGVLLPATTALASLETDGRKKGILAGANVVMPNLSPVVTRKDYSLYDNKRCLGDEAAEGVGLLKEEMKDIGYEIVVSRGDSLVKPV